jgi:hypothetical protein
LNLPLESEFLNQFNFQITGLNLEQKAAELVDEFYDSRDLRPLKILIDGSPFAFQPELADMIANFYSLHRIQNACFLDNFSQRLVNY